MLLLALVSVTICTGSPTLSLYINNCLCLPIQQCKISRFEKRQQNPRKNAVFDHFLWQTTLNDPAISNLNPVEKSISNYREKQQSFVIITYYTCNVWSLWNMIWKIQYLFLCSDSFDIWWYFDTQGFSSAAVILERKIINRVTDKFYRPLPEIPNVKCRVLSCSL